MIKDFEDYIKEYSQLKDFKPIIELISKHSDNLEIVNSQSFVLIEKMTKMILMERAIPFEDSEKHNKLLKKLYDEFYFDKSDKESITTLTNGLNSISKSIEFTRDKRGAHGRVEPEKRGELSRLIFKNTLSFCNFLWESHLEYAKDKIIIDYEANSDFNEWFDKDREDLIIEVYF